MCLPRLKEKNMEPPVVEYRFVNSFHKIFLLLVLILLFSYPVLFPVYVSSGEPQQQTKKEKEEAILILQVGISLIKQEIKRDQSIVSAGIRVSRDIRRVRETLRNGIAKKEKLIVDLRSSLASSLPAEIDALQENLDQEKEISGGFITSSRVRRLTTETIKQSIPVKQDVLAAFEQLLSELKQDST